MKGERKFEGVTSHATHSPLVKPTHKANVGMSKDKGGKKQTDKVRSY